MDEQDVSFHISSVSCSGIPSETVWSFRLLAGSFSMTLHLVSMILYVIDKSTNNITLFKYPPILTCFQEMAF